MKKLILVIALVAAYFQFAQPQDVPRLSASQVSTGQDGQGIAAAYRDRRSDVQVQGHGTVSRILPDDNNGSRHQRFILRMDTGQTVLVAHNIDLAPRAEQLKEGDTVAFNGEYEWNEKGGVVHWTHHDPANRHTHGWLKHHGITYQ